MAQYFAKQDPQSYEKGREQGVDFSRKVSSSATQKEKRKRAMKSPHISSEEDDYNFLSDEGENDKESITTHLKNNHGHRGLISALVSKNPLQRERSRKGAQSKNKGGAIPSDYASYVRRQKMHIPAPTQAISKLNKMPME